MQSLRGFISRSENKLQNGKHGEQYTNLTTLINAVQINDAKDSPFVKRAIYDIKQYIRTLKGEELRQRKDNFLIRDAVLKERLTELDLWHTAIRCSRDENDDYYLLKLYIELKYRAKNGYIPQSNLRDIVSTTLDMVTQGLLVPVLKNRETPEELCCEISKERMTHPVIITTKDKNRKYTRTLDFKTYDKLGVNDRGVKCDPFNTLEIVGKPKPNPELIDKIRFFTPCLAPEGKAEYEDPPRLSNILVLG